MVWGHYRIFFLPPNPWLHIPDRILFPVFMITVGYNTGHKPGKMLWAGAVIIFLIQLIFTGKLYIQILGAIIFVKYITEPLASWLVTDRQLFWIFNFFLAITAPIVNLYVCDFGTLTLMMSIAGWMSKNRADLPDNIKLHHYFIFVFFSYMLFTVLVFQFFGPYLVFMGAGAAITMWMLYDFRQLILNSLRNKPKTVVRKISHFIGHKSMEIYIIHVVAFLLYYHLS